MAPANLHGLNVIQQSPQFDSHDLLPGQHFPELAAQLDLWTSLPFESEEPAVFDKDEEESGSMSHSPPEKPSASAQPAHNSQQPGQPYVDIQTLLSTFGLDPFLSQQLSHQQVPTPAAAVPSLAQLLAIHSAQAALRQNPLFPPHLTAPVTSSAPPVVNPISALSPSPSTDDSSPPAKRTRTRKASVSTADVADAAGSAVSIAEDKRRRNTAASARFRLKKKEREAALETKAKELETRVNELERECEGLRRENGWLKGLVVGVTGAAGSNNVPSLTHTTNSSLKRPRDDGA